MHLAQAESRDRRSSLTLGRLGDVPHAELIALHNDPRVLRHLPLGREEFDEATCRRWVVEKEGQWQEHGYGPWSIHVKGGFAGWGGFQHEQGEADLALVLAVEYWGIGSAVCHKMLHIAFDDMGLTSVTALLPPGRVRVKGMRRLGFQRDGQLHIGEIAFHRYRRWAPWVTPGHRNGE
ncbi:MAG: GNAT family N-acetyltransferase [Alcanivorax sp.]|uniref:GNAT family N-acetyltransferase n=1 Tax=Alcanivorax sp. TaxID=1872427 RepID=UPI003DA79FC8